MEILDWTLIGLRMMMPAGLRRRNLQSADPNETERRKPQKFRIQVRPFPKILCRLFNTPLFEVYFEVDFAGNKHVLLVHLFDLLIY